METGEIWVFSTLLIYTSSAQPFSCPTPEPVEAIKIFYKRYFGQSYPTCLNPVGTAQSQIPSKAQGSQAPPQGDSLNKASLQVEDLTLPVHLDAQLWRCLETSNKLLPTLGAGGGGRKFIDWDVGLLRRFTAADVNYRAGL